MALLAVTSGVSENPADDLIRTGDVFDARLEAAEALKSYLPAEKQDPANARLLVRIARQYRHLMSDAHGREEKLRLGGMAIEYSRRAVALAPDDPEPQLALAISYGKLLPYEGSKEQFASVPIIKAAADKVTTLDPHNDLGWQVLGRWYLNVAAINPLKHALARIVYGELPSGKYEDAVRCFEKAIELNPRRLMHYIELGRTFAQMGRMEEARKFITKGLAMPDTEKDDPETKERGRKILEELH